MKYQRHTTDCRGMSPEQKREHVKNQNRASLLRRRADPEWWAKRQAYRKEYNRHHRAEP